MALKLRVREICEKCGQRDATLWGDRIRVWHECPHRPPGPPDGPRSYHVSEVILERGEFTVDELVAQVDAARAEAAYWHGVAVKAHHALRPAIEAIERARAATAPRALGA